MRLGNKSTRNAQKDKVEKNVACLKRFNVKLITTIMHQMKPLRDFLYLNREQLRTFIIQDMSHDYKKNANIGKEKKNCTKKFARKRCSSQLNN